MTEEIAEPGADGGSPNPLGIDFESARASYGELTATYARALGYVGSLRRRRPADDPPGKIDPVSLYWVASVARLLTGAHIRKRLEALTSRCAQLEMALDRDMQQDNTAWLAEVRAAAEATASSLPSLRRPSVYVLAPFLFGFISAGGGLGVGDLPKAVWAVVSAVVFVLALIMFAVAGFAFTHKRQALLPGAGPSIACPENNNSRTQARTHIGARTTCSPRSDRVGHQRPNSTARCSFFGAFLPFEFAVVYGVVFVDNESILLVLFLGGFAILVGAAALGDWLFPTRVWR